MMPETWSLQEALVAVLFSAATADDELDDLERAELLVFERRSRSLRCLRPDEVSALNKRVIERLRYGEATLSGACAALPAEARLPAFAQALDLMLADGDLSAAEADFVNTLLLRLNLAGAEVTQVAEALAVKNRI